MSKDLLQMTAGILIGVVFWVYGYLEHKRRPAQSPIYHQTFQSPRWLFRLSGKPRDDGQLEIGGVIFQVTGVLLPAVSFVMVVLGVGFRDRAIVVTLILPVLAVVTSACARLLLDRVRRWSA